MFGVKTVCFVRAIDRCEIQNHSASHIACEALRSVRAIRMVKSTIVVRVIAWMEPDMQVRADMRLKPRVLRASHIICEILVMRASHPRLLIPSIACEPRISVKSS